MPAPTKIKPARMGPNWNMVHGIRCQINQTTPAPDGTGLTPVINRALITGKAVHIGTIPAGSFILPVDVQIKTLFDGTTPALIVGDLADDDGILTSAEAAAGTAGYKKNLSGGAYIGVTDVDLNLYVKLTAAGNTAGRADILVRYYHNAD